MLSLLTLLACTGGLETAAGAPDILVIAVDGLREDIEGVSASTAALIDGLGRAPRARFTAAYAQSVQPAVSLASLLTGRYPSAIPFCGLPTQRPGQPRGEAPWCAVLPEGQPTLPGVLSLYGYQTAAMSVRVGQDDVLVGPFDEVLPAALGDARGWGAPDWAGVRAAVGAWWRDPRRAEDPRLVFLATQPLRRERLEAAAGLRPQEVLQGIPPEQVPAVRRAYDALAGRIGEQIGALIEDLEPGEGGRPLWVVLTSAHGMSLGERSGSVIPSHAASPGHKLLLDRTLRVPLLLYGPGPTGAVVEHPVELVDVLPTLTGLAGAVQPAGLPGEDLLAQIDRAPAEALAYAEYGDMLALRQGRDLLTFRSWNHGGSSLDPQVTERLEQSEVGDGSGVRPGDRLGTGAAALGPAAHTGGAEGARVVSPDQMRQFTLYDVIADPMQVRDRAREDPQRVEAMRALLLARRTGPGTAPQDVLSPERVRALRASGAVTYW